MKFSFKKLLSLILIISIVSFNASTINATYNEFLEKNGIQMITTEYSQIIKSISSTQTIINETNLKLLKSTLKKQNCSLYEQNIRILQEIGFSDTALKTMNPKDVENLFQDAIKITAETVYMKVNTDGTSLIISEEECMEAVNKKHSNTSSKDSNNDGWGNYTSNDGYMRLTISSEYINPSVMNNEKGWYYFHTWYEWLIAPNYRLTDAISIAAPNCTWDTFNAPNAYYSTMCYSAIDINGNHGRFDAPSKTTQNLTITPDGAYYEWNMPLSSLDTEIYYIQFYIRARARVTSFTLAQSIGVYAKYVHTYASINVDPSFSWSSTGEIGVSLDFNLLIYDDVFYYNLNHSYTP